MGTGSKLPSSRDALRALAVAAAVTLIPVAGARAEPNPSAARSRIVQAKIALEQDDADAADDKLREAEDFVDGASDADRKAIYAAIDEVKATLPAHRKAAKAAKAKLVMERLDGQIRSADEAAQTDAHVSAQDLDVVEERLKSDDVKAALDEAAIQQVRGRVAESRKKVAAVEKRDALERAAPSLKELEEKLSKDPFKGLDEPAAYDAATDLDALEKAVRGQIGELPRADPEVKAVYARLAKADAKIAAASKKWGGEQAEQQVTRTWSSTKEQVGDWEAEEAPAPSDKTFGDTSVLPKTSQALREASYWLADADRKKLREEFKENEAIGDAFKEAEKVVVDAGKKLNDAFGAMMAVGERMPVPHERASELERPDRMIEYADGAFAGTPYHDANVARAKALKEKWEAELKRRAAAYAAARKQLTDQATAAWPGIDGAIRADDDFDATNAQHWQGRKVRLKGVYNRSGWDDDGKWGFMTKRNGVFVAGNYEPKIAQALREASEKIGDAVDDHITWDVIAVVEGADTVNQRSITEVVDATTRERIGKLESYPPAPCVKVRVIALHAGPVAVGP